MGVGGSIALLVIGAILAFGVSDVIEGVDLSVIGYICMGAGALALVLVIALGQRRSSTTYREVVQRPEDRQPPPTV